MGVNKQNKNQRLFVCVSFYYFIFFVTYFQRYFNSIFFSGFLFLNTSFSMKKKKKGKEKRRKIELIRKSLVFVLK